MKGDVYPVEPDDEFAFQKVLDPHWGVVYGEDVRIHSSTTFNSMFFSSLVQKHNSRLFVDKSN